jgi:phage shock protein A
VASPDPAGERRAQAAAAFAAAMQPLAEAYLRAAAQLGENLAEWCRQITPALAQIVAALEASHGGVRAELGDPTGDPPMSRG